jgi:OOP family OmpA-OmpF porin
MRAAYQIHRRNAFDGGGRKMLYYSVILSAHSSIEKEEVQMIIKKLYRPLVGVLGLAVSLSLGAASARAELANCTAKIDNFVLFADQSGSMYQTHAEAGDIKERLVKRLLTQINEQIPHLAYKGGVYLFAPFEETMEVKPYRRWAITTGISRIADVQPVAGRLTPMGNGISDLSEVVKGLTGKTAVITFSDGRSNTGEDPVESTRTLLAGRSDVCVDVVSFADTDEGQETNRAVSKVGQGCHYAEGLELMRDGVKLEQFVRDIFCGAAKPKRKIVLRGVNFDFDESTIRSDGKPVLDEAVRTLKEEAGITVSVEGHTDAVGSDAYNQGLSERRADAVADYLAAGGVARRRLSTVGFGEAKPVASNETEDGRAQNRRVEFRISE